MPRLCTIVLVILPLLVGHLFLPLSLVSHLWRASLHDRLTWLSALYFAGSYGAFIYLAGAWSWFGNVTRRFLAALLVLAALTTVPRGGAEAVFSRSAAIEFTLRIVLGTVFVAMAILAFLGRRLRQPALDLALPLRGGTFIVGQGGANRVVNYHFVPRSATRWTCSS